MITFDATEFQQGLTTRSLLLIAELLGDEVAQSLDPEVVAINVDTGLLL